MTEKTPPSNPDEPQGSSWSTHYIKLDHDGILRDLEGNIRDPGIQHPDTIDWDQQLITIQKMSKKLTKKQIRMARYWGTGVPAEASRLRELAEECAKSRMYAGVHFPVDCEEGLKLGRAIGQSSSTHAKNRWTLSPTRLIFLFWRTGVPSCGLLFFYTRT